MTGIGIIVAFLAGIVSFASPCCLPLVPAYVGYMVGTTGGYLVGFLLAVAVMGCLAERGWLRDGRRGIALLLLGSAIPLALGWAWLATLVGAGKAFTLGVSPFLVGGAVKLALAASLLPLARRAPRPS